MTRVQMAISVESAREVTGTSQRVTGYSDRKLLSYRVKGPTTRKRFLDRYLLLIQLRSCPRPDRNSEAGREYRQSCRWAGRPPDLAGLLRATVWLSLGPRLPLRAAGPQSS